MPRTYVRKRTRNKWSVVQLTAAKKAVESGELSIHSAGTKYGISKTIIANYIHGLSTSTLCSHLQKKRN